MFKLHQQAQSRGLPPAASVLCVCRHPEVVRRPMEQAQPCVGKRRGRTSLRKALDRHRSQGKAEHGWCCHLPRGLSTQRCSGKGGNHIRWGNAQDHPKKSCPKGDHNPPHTYVSSLCWLTMGLARAALLYPKHLPSTPLSAPLQHLLEVSRIHALGATRGCVLGFKTDVASVSTI